MPQVYYYYYYNAKARSKRGRVLCLVHLEPKILSTNHNSELSPGGQL